MMTITLQAPLLPSLSLSVYIYIYIYVRVCEEH